MGLVDRIERKLESTVGDAFARVFGGAIVPQEVEAMLRREADAGAREVLGGRVLAPNDYVITLSVPDYQKVSADPDLTSATFAKHLEGYIHEQGWQTYADVVVRFEQSSNLHTGQFRARGAVNPDATAGEPAPPPRDLSSNAESGVPPMSDNPSYRGGQGPGRAADEPYDDRYSRQPDDRPQDPRGQYVPPDQGAYPPPPPPPGDQGYPPRHGGGYPDQGGYPDHGGYPEQGGYPDQGYPPSAYEQRPPAGYAPPAAGGYPDQGYRQPPPNYGPPPGGQPGYGPPPADYDYGRGPARPDEGYGRPEPRPGYPDQGYPEQGGYPDQGGYRGGYGRQDQGYAPPDYGRYGEPAGGYAEPGYGEPAGGGYDYGQPGYGAGYGQPDYPAATAVTLQLDDGSGRTYQLREGSNVIGRGQDAQFRLPDTGVSRRHLEIRWDGQVALLSDLNSTNGTTVNNAPVQEWQLADGDVIRLGHSEIIVRVH
ncbi:FhaA domain-containing protein [Mycolicibacterium sp. XJ2546]